MRSGASESRKGWPEAGSTLGLEADLRLRGVVAAGSTPKPPWPGPGAEGQVLRSVRLCDGSSSLPFIRFESEPQEENLTMCGLTLVARWPNVTASEPSTVLARLTPKPGPVPALPGTFYTSPSAVTVS